MNAHLVKISLAVDPGAHAVLMLDGAGWHVAGDLVVPDNIKLLQLPAVITQACDGWDQAPTVLRMVPNGLWPARRAVSTTVRMAASPSAAHIAR